MEIWWNLSGFFEKPWYERLIHCLHGAIYSRESFDVHKFWVSWNVGWWILGCSDGHESRSWGTVIMSHGHEVKRKADREQVEVDKKRRKWLISTYAFIDVLLVLTGQVVFPEPIIDACYWLSVSENSASITSSSPPEVSLGAASSVASAPGASPSPPACW